MESKIQNAMCFIEHYMGIYPNVEPLTDKEMNDLLTLPEGE